MARQGEATADRERIARNGSPACRAIWSRALANGPRGAVAVDWAMVTSLVWRLVSVSTASLPPREVAVYPRRSLLNSLRLKGLRYPRAIRVRNRFGLGPPNVKGSAERN